LRLTLWLTLRLPLHLANGVKLSRVIALTLRLFRHLVAYLPLAQVCHLVRLLAEARLGLYVRRLPAKLRGFLWLCLAQPRAQVVQHLRLRL
jgi:hypothetical protein